MLKHSCQQSKSVILDLLLGCYSIEKIALQFLRSHNNQNFQLCLCYEVVITEINQF